MGHENKNRTNVDSATSSQSNNLSEGKYLFGDYSPLEENKNIVDMLKDFVSISAHVLQIHRNVDKLNFLLKNTEILQEGINTRMSLFKTTSESAMDTFYEEFYERMIKVLFPDLIDSEPFYRIKNSLVRSITDVERECAIRFDEYKRYVRSKMEDSYMSSMILLQAWLSKDEHNLPSTLISKASNVLIVNVEEDGGSYRISRTTEIMLGSDRETDNIATPSVSYSFYVDTSIVGFWNSNRKVLDLGIDQMSIPIGFKTSISEKLKRSFRLGHSSEQSDSERELDLISAENYYITHAKLERGKSLSVILSDESRPTDKVLRIEYDLKDLYADTELSTVSARSSNYTRLIAEGKVPRVEYVDEKETRRIDLLQKQFYRATDISCIMNMGSKLEEKLREVLDSRIMSSHVKLYSIRVSDKEAAVLNNDQTAGNHLSYDEDLIISFLGSIASGFASLIQMLIVKSPIKGELILRYDAPNKQREEYMVRISDIVSQLSSTSGGKKILSSLGLFYENNANSDAVKIPKN